MMTDCDELVRQVSDEVVRRLQPYLRAPGAVEPEYLPLAGVATLTGLSYDFVYNAVHGGELPAVKKGRVWRVKASDARAWMDRDRGGSPPPSRPELKAKVSRYLPGLKG